MGHVENRLAALERAAARQDESLNYRVFYRHEDDPEPADYVLGERHILVTFVSPKLVGAAHA